MFQFTRLAAKYLWIQYPLIQESRDHRLFVNYPRLIADLHAFHRLLMPRHPPYTLNSLTTNIQLFPSRQPEGQQAWREPFILQSQSFKNDRHCVQTTYNDILLNSIFRHVCQTYTRRFGYPQRYSRVVFMFDTSPPEPKFQPWWIIHIDAIYFTNKLSKINATSRFFELAFSDGRGRHASPIYGNKLSLTVVLESAFELKVRSHLFPTRRQTDRTNQLKGSPHQGSFLNWVRDSMTFSVGVNRK